MFVQLLPDDLGSSYADVVLHCLSTNIIYPNKQYCILTIFVIPIDFIPLIKQVTQFLITPFSSNEGKQMFSIISKNMLHLQERERVKVRAITHTYMSPPCQFYNTFFIYSKPKLYNCGLFIFVGSLNEDKNVFSAHT